MIISLYFLISYHIWDDKQNKCKNGLQTYKYNVARMLKCTISSLLEFPKLLRLPFLPR